MSQQKIEKWVNRLVTKPISLALYGSWLASYYIASIAKSGAAWLRRRLSRRSIGAAGAGVTK